MGRQHTAIRAVIGEVQGAMGTSLSERLNPAGRSQRRLLRRNGLQDVPYTRGWLTPVPWARAACCLLWDTAHELRIVSTFLNL